MHALCNILNDFTGFLPMWVYLLAAAFIGFAFSFQPVINASMGAALGSPMIAAVVSVVLTLLCLLLLLPVFGSGEVRLSSVS